MGACCWNRAQPLSGKGWLKYALDCLGSRAGVSLCVLHMLSAAPTSWTLEMAWDSEKFFRLWTPSVKAQIPALSAQLPWKTLRTSNSTHSSPDRAPEVFLPSAPGSCCLLVRVSHDTETCWSLGQRQFQM